MASPTTPVSNRTRPVEVTPLNAGSGSNTEHEQRNHQFHYAPYLRQDLRKTLVLPFDKMAEIICKVYAARKWTAPSRRLPKSLVKEHQKFFDLPDNEEARYAPFALLANSVLDYLRHRTVRFCRNDPKHIAGSSAKRKPDVVAVPKDLLKSRRTIKAYNKNASQSPFWWHELLLFQEFATAAEDWNDNKSRSSKKRPSEDYLGSETRKRLKQSHDRIQTIVSESSSYHNLQGEAATTTPKNIQCASYALEMAANSGFRDFVIGAYTKGSKTFLIYYDHSAIIQSDLIDISNLKNLIKLLDVLVISGFGTTKLASLRLASRPSSDLPSPRENYEEFFAGAILKLEQGAVSLDLGKTLFRQHGLICRGTIVVEAKVRPRSRLSAGQVCVVKMYRPAATRVSESLLISQARGLAETEMPGMLRHLPNVLASETRPSAALHQELHQFFKEDYELRRVDIVVMDQLHHIQNEVLDATDLQAVFRDIFHCYRWLYQKAKIQHRDISMGNVMYRNHGTRVYGVLNDFDHALDISNDPQGPSSNQRTGTLPYMAIGVHELAAGPHYYRYDLESLYYVMITFVSPKDHFVDQIHRTTSEDLAYVKRGHFISKSVKPIDELAIFESWCHRLRLMFANGYFREAQSELHPDTFDAKTLDQQVTFDTFENIVGPYVP
ncbi:hypothetical protein BKA62DRAFT_776392 [Auriculariales sp. MPI-PUGE-AT-0066]|nr:hypothetical protein BKA62DRAFT_776392 [Auriculariales sp. MPI-PUGE-AT-0066]